MAKQKERLDKLLLDRSLVESRAKARARIMAGDAFVNGQRVDKPGSLVATDASIELRGAAPRYVSRGGDKLASALTAFAFDCTGKTVIDVGASTGGFTDCVLQLGASLVYAVDVGYGQLAWSLRSDPRVVVLERANIRTLPPEAIPTPVDLAVIDCSFISLSKVIPPTLPFLQPHADLIVLIKPQFEAGREGVGKGGVVRDTEVRQHAIQGTIDNATSLGLTFVQGIDSPVHGPAGNIEYLAWLRR